MKQALIGGFAWVLFALLIWAFGPRQDVWPIGLLLLSPMVLFPLVLELAEPDRDGNLRRAGATLWPTSFFLGPAYYSDAGVLTAVIALGWVALTALVAVAGLDRLRREGFRSPAQLAVIAGLVYLGVGGAWLLADRLGVRPLDFEPIIVLLTAIHFHYAGFVLPILTGLAAERIPGRLASAASLGVVAGVPLVAAGITATQLGAGFHLEMAASWWLALAAAASAALHLRLALEAGPSRRVRVLWVLSALSLLFGMTLAALYGSRAFLPLARLDIPGMALLHGTANAFGFALCGVLGWWLYQHSGHRSDPAPS